jgi:hypothetical protein
MNTGVFARVFGITVAVAHINESFTELLDNGKPFERMGRKAAGLNLLFSGRHGSRAAEGKRLHPPRIQRLA